MRRRSVLVLSSFLLSIYFSACHSPSAPATTAAGDPGPAKTPLPMFKRNPENRDPIKKEPVAEYRVRTDDRLNEQFFTVRLYETAQTMRYRVKMEFEGLAGEDTVKLPDLGTAPHPALEKGSEKYACILGLLDNDHKFRELKKVYVTPNGRSLKITTLKHYAVTENYHLVDQ